MSMHRQGLQPGRLALLASLFAACSVPTDEPMVSAPTAAKGDFVSSTFEAGKLYAPDHGNTEASTAKAEEFSAGAYRSHRWELPYIPLLARLRINTFETFEPVFLVEATIPTGRTFKLHRSWATPVPVEGSPGVYEANLKLTRAIYQNELGPPHSSVFIDVMSVEASRDVDARTSAADGHEVARYEIQAMPVRGWNVLERELDCDGCDQLPGEVSSWTSRSPTLRVSLEEETYVTKLSATVQNARLRNVVVETAEGARLERRHGALSTAGEDYEAVIAHRAQHVDLTFEVTSNYSMFGSSFPLEELRVEGLDRSEESKVEWVDMRTIPEEEAAAAE